MDISLDRISSSSSSLSSDNSQSTCPQLGNAIFESHCIFDKLLPADPSALNSVLLDIKKVYNIDCSNLRYRPSSGRRMKRWPNPSEKRLHYQPFAWLLNAILDSSRRNMKIWSVNNELRFHSYDRTMVEDGDDVSALKPGVVGCDLVAVSGSHHLSWKNVKVSVEIHSQWQKMISQASKNAQFCLAFQKNKRFATVIHYNYTNLEVRVGFYTRSGLVTTPAFVISTPDGFHNLVHAMVGIYSWTTLGAAGIDTSRSETFFNIPDAGHYSCTKVCYEDTWVRGQATRVYKLRLETEDPVLLEGIAGLSRGLLVQTVCRYPLRNHVSDIDAEQNTNCSIPCNPKTDQTATSSTCPSVIILKDSWPLESQEVETNVFGKLKEHFGLPVVILSYDVNITAGTTDQTTEIIPNDSIHWDVFGSNQEGDVRPERRIHRRVVSTTEGFPLLDSEGPRQLVEAVVHAMLGHFSLFKSGWLHGDVSYGNVMLMKEEARLPVEDFDIAKTLTRCTGFLSDGDRATRWTDDQLPLPSRPSGTLPFMSLRLLWAWGTSKRVKQTAVDDLESFVWVLLWTVLKILQAKDVLVATDTYYLAVMRSDGLDTQWARYGVLELLQLQQEDDDFSRGFAPFAPLLIGWLEVARIAHLRPLSTHDVANCKDVYRKYIEIGLRHAQTLPETWGYAEKVPELCNNSQ